MHPLHEKYEMNW